ncbi:hypothetical protein GCM10010174_03510 [Kutzneria viridogrisea]
MRVSVTIELDDVAHAVDAQLVVPDRQGPPHRGPAPVAAGADLVNRGVGEVAADGVEIGLEVGLGVDERGLTWAVGVVLQRRDRDTARVSGGGRVGHDAVQPMILLRCTPVGRPLSSTLTT